MSINWADRLPDPRLAELMRKINENAELVSVELGFFAGLLQRPGATIPKSVVQKITPIAEALHRNAIAFCEVCMMGSLQPIFGRDGDPWLARMLNHVDDIRGFLELPESARYSLAALCAITAETNSHQRENAVMGYRDFVNAATEFNEGFCKVFLPRVTMFLNTDRTPATGDESDSTPPDPFAEPRRIAKDMGPVSRKIVEVICDRGGSVPLGELAKILEWGDATGYANFQSHKTRITKQLTKQLKGRWKLFRRSNTARLEPIGK